VTDKAITDPNEFATELFNGLPPRYDRLGKFLSMGQDRVWRRALVSHIKATRGDKVLDVATGPGGIAFAIRDYTGADVVGIDLNQNMVDLARSNAESRGDTGVSFLQGRAEDLPFADGEFDAVSFSYLLRYVADPKATIAELCRVLRPGGTIASMEFYVPPNPVWRGLWWCYTRIVLPIAGYATGGREWFKVGRFLGPNIEGHYRRYPLRWTIKAWEDSGVRNVSAQTLSLGGGLVMWGTKAEDA
jgi:demethylmenaquinone methyltransferase/2-methoxy-6-polyprenyl-1,4-benzoquinol methylase